MRTPSHFRQNFRAGDTVTGVVYGGTAVATRDTDYKFLLTENPASGQGAIDGGLIPLTYGIPSNFPGIYRKITAAYISLPGVSWIDLLIVEPDTDTEMSLPYEYTDTSKFAMQLTEREYGIPIGWGFKVKSSGETLTGDGFIYIATEIWEIPPMA